MSACTATEVLKL